MSQDGGTASLSPKIDNKAGTASLAAGPAQSSVEV
jgi:hypothetical protein